MLKPAFTDCPGLVELLTTEWAVRDFQNCLPDSFSNILKVMILLKIVLG